jgi:hypothetical protein
MKRVILLNLVECTEYDIHRLRRNPCDSTAQSELFDKLVMLDFYSNDWPQVTVKTSFIKICILTASLAITADPRLTSSVLYLDLALDTCKDLQKFLVNHPHIWDSPRTRVAHS